MWITLVIFIFSVVLSGLFSGVETGIYRLSHLRLKLGVTSRRRQAMILDKCVRDRSAILVSDLVGNNMASYLATSAATWFMLDRLEGRYAAELAATLVTTPILFIFAELVPKTVFFYRADSLLPIFAPVLYVFHRIFTLTGLVPFLRFLSSTLSRLAGRSDVSQSTASLVEQSHLKEIVHYSREEAIFSSMQTEIMQRVVGVAQLAVKAVMTPMYKVEMLEKGSGKNALLARLKKTMHSRLPVYDRRRENVIGMINIHRTVASGGDFSDLSGFIMPIRRISGNTTVIEAINTMQAEKLRMLLVTRPPCRAESKPIGIVTMKDLAEELVGELAEW